jgi:hypothetical protein
MAATVQLDRRPAGYVTDIASGSGQDFGFMLGALTLGRLALAGVPARRAGTLPRRPWSATRTAADTSRA